MPERLEALAVHRGTQLALVDENGHATYGDLAAAAHGVGAAFLARGLRPGDRVATAMAPSLVHVLVVLGCLRAGIVVTPLNTRLAAVEARTFLEPIDPRLIIADALHVELAEELGIEGLELPHALADGEPADRLAPLCDREAATLSAVGERAPAILFPTGGTTGMPKAAFYDHRGMWMWLNSGVQTDPPERDGCELFCLPFFHVSLGVALLSRLFGGATVRIQRSFVPADVLRAFGEGVTAWTAAPTMLAALRAHKDFSAAPRERLRRLTFGSSPASDAFVAQVLQEYPRARIRTAYGATEIGPVTGMEHEDLVGGRTGVGRPLPGVRIRVVGQDGHEMPVGEVGELVVASPWQTQGYWNDPQETARVYRPEGVHTGDLGYLDDGWLHLAGRDKDMIISGGENVFPVEVETVLAQHPAVQAVLVYGMPDELWGERVEAAVVLKPGAVLELEALREFARAGLAGYKLPRGLRVLDAVPLTPNNKPDRRAVREQALTAVAKDRGAIQKEIA